MLYRLFPSLVQHLLWIPVRFILFVTFGFHAKGLENLKGLDLSNGVIIATNHAAKIDPIILIAAISLFSPVLPVFSVTMDPKEYSKHGPVKYLMKPGFAKLYGGYPVKRGLKDYELALRNFIGILKDRGTVFIFPEGKMTRDGAVGKPRPGIGYLVETSGAIVIPAAINGTYRYSISKGLSRSQTISVTFGKPFTSDELLASAPDDKPDRFYHVANQITSVIEELTLQ